ncbi:MAG: serpin family protein [Firmicutes bacterium]|nr:serpin family protein [Bacillota bacterium]MDY5856329.1 serpin family protein [Anaerovoracaceae bacterium]
MKEKRNNEEKKPGEKILRRKIGAKTLTVCLLACLTLGLAGCGAGESGGSDGEAGKSVELTGAAEGVPGLSDGSQAYCFTGEEDGLTVKEQFLVDARQYFDAEVYRAAFDDGTVKDMNRWCSEKTDGMVEDMIRELPEDEVIHLMNAVCFDGTWQDPYEKHQIRKDVFTSENGAQQNVDFMYSTEFVYLEGEYETGFVKPYQDGYSFVALLPKMDLDAEAQTDSRASQAMSMAEYVQSLTGERFRELITSAFSSASEVPVETAMPAFQMEYTADKEKLIPVLQSMGMTDLFDSERADLTGMAVSARENLYVSGVAQKCFIEVNAEGTRAAAVTDIAVSDECAPVFDEMKTVRLDRPFVFAIVDDRCGVPVFLGVVTEVE